MHRIPLPTTSGTNSFTTVVSTIRSKEKRNQYSNLEPLVTTCCGHYDNIASLLNFENATIKKLAVKIIKEADMIKLYEKQFVKNKGSKTIRDSVTNASPNGLCPYCGQGSVHELDHYLPKDLFTGITVYPPNLIPSCRDCNREKSNYFPDSSKPAVLHPYFDNAFSFRWLYATISEHSNGMPTAEFEVRVDPSNIGLKTRLESHLSVFKLYDRYRVFASQSLNNFEMLIKSPHGQGMTLKQAKHHLKVTGYQQSGGRENSWELALNEAMANSDWYLKTYLNLP